MSLVAELLMAKHLAEYHRKSAEDISTELGLPLDLVESIMPDSPNELKDVSSMGRSASFRRLTPEERRAAYEATRPAPFEEEIDVPSAEPGEEV